MIRWSAVAALAACSTALVACSASPSSQVSPACAIQGINKATTFDTTSNAGIIPFHLTCNQPFKISVVGYGGDTAHIHFAFVEAPDSAYVTHDVQVTRLTWKSSQKFDTAWMAVSAIYNGTPSYDTCWGFMYLP